MFSYFFQKNSQQGSGSDPYLSVFSKGLDPNPDSAKCLDPQSVKKDPKHRITHISICTVPRRMITGFKEVLRREIQGLKV